MSASKKSKNDQSTKAAVGNEIQSGEEGFKKIEKRLGQLPDTDVVSPNIDVQAASVVALGAATRLNEPGARKKILAIAKAGALDLSLIDDLPAVAWGAWFARHKLLQASATHSKATLPVSLVQAAVELRSRMLKVLDYHLDGDENGTARLSAIRSGSGHLDLADDLTALASLFKEHKAAISADKKNYRAADEKQARETATKIVKQLGSSVTPDERRWKDTQARAFTLLLRHYEEALRVGRFLFHREGGDKLFPSLYSAVRSAPTSSSSKAPVESPVSEGAPGSP